VASKIVKEIYDSGATTTSIPVCSPTSVCPSCGEWTYPTVFHVCKTTYIPTHPPSTTYTVGSTMKHINWQEYVPAKPPVTTGDYLIVYTDTGGTKRLTRGQFQIDSAYKHKWFDESYLEIFQTVTHYAKIELP
jgi:hypothetical protein